MSAADLSWSFGPEVLSDFERGSELEWLETNGLGGWASGTASGALSRRYHGLLVAASSPRERRVLLAKLEETLGAGEEVFPLACNRFPGAVFPQGHRHLTRFERGLFPVFDFEAGGVRLRKTIAAIHGENTTLVLYEVRSAPGPFTLELLPLCAGRDIHALGGITPERAAVGELTGGVLAVRMAGEPELALAVPGARFVAEPLWYHRFELDRERERGFDFREDLSSPGRLLVELGPGAKLGVLITAGADPARDPWALFAAERARREALRARCRWQAPLGRALALAADQFLVAAGEELETVIAGYPWFTDWGRDTMIALPGLCFATGRAAEAKPILRAFARAVDRGMLPNRFPDRGEAPEYNTADASLWFFVAVRSYLEATGDEALVRDELLPVLREILRHHLQGTRYGIYEDNDGLLHAGEAGVQLTWMDAKVGEWVVTPRVGKPVEINALWVNALATAAELERRLGSEAAAARWAARAARAAERFSAEFWCEEKGYLYDVLDGESRDARLRPNQLLALCLPVPLFTPEQAERILGAVEAKLLTPVGLRTLSPDDPDYCPRYEGGPRERDGAYHQGTVWPWLLGPYLTALVRYRGAAGAARARELLNTFAVHLGEACVGSVAEIFDAEPPHRPRGAVAQAWSVAELLRLGAALAEGAP